MTRLVTIFGGAGFVGRYIARRMAKQGWRVRVVSRRPNESLFVRTYGSVGQVEPVFANIRDDASVAAVLAGADAVVNCVGTFDAGGRNNFQAVQVDGAGRIARLAAAECVETMVHLSAIGADSAAESEYAQTKAAGEAAVLAHMPQAVILRPSVIFGTEDAFFNRFAAMARLSPVVPLIGGKTLFQPVFVDDVAAAAEKALTGAAEPGVYELGGPEAASFRDLIRQMLGVVQRRRLLIDIPFWAAGAIAFVADMVHIVSGGLLPNPVATRDQVKSLRVDNVVSDGARGFSDLGITPATMEAVLPSYLWRFRHSGQYAAIKDSARNLRT